MIDLQRSGMIFFDEILANEKLSSTAKLIAGKILSLTNCGEKECFLSNGFICKTFGLSKPTAIKAVKELELMEYIKANVRFKPDSNLPLRYVSWIYKTGKETLLCQETLPSKESLLHTGKETLLLTGKESLPKYKNINIRKENKNIYPQNQKSAEDINQPTNTNRITTDNLNQPVSKLPTVTTSKSVDNENQSTLTDLNKKIKERGAAAGGAVAVRFVPPTEAEMLAFIKEYISDPKKIKTHDYFPTIDAEIACEEIFNFRESHGWKAAGKAIKDWKADAKLCLTKWKNLRGTKKQNAEDFEKEYEQSRSFTDFLKEKEQNVLDVEYTENELLENY